MNFKNYIKDKIICVILFCILLFLSSILLFIFNDNIIVNIIILLLIALVPSLCLVFEYKRRKNFYNYIQRALKKQNGKIRNNNIVKPNFLEGEIIEKVLRNTNRLVEEKTKEYRINNSDLEEYIENWHKEIKKSIDNTQTLIETDINANIENIEQETKRIDNLCEQLLFYAKSKNMNNKFNLSKVNLENIVKRAVIRNKKDFINKKISLEVRNLNVNVNSNDKWLEFIINQILINSIKFSKPEKAKIWIYTIKENNNINLYIEDNGIGISKNDLTKVFDKGFRGENAKNTNSSGMGLYLCKTISNSLYHKIKILSQENFKTAVIITFPLNSYMDIIK